MIVVLVALESLICVLNWAVSLNRENRGLGPHGPLLLVGLDIFVHLHWLQLVMDFREFEVNCALWNF